MPDIHTRAANILKSGYMEGLPQGHFIDGKLTTTSQNRTLESFDPGSGKAFASFATGDEHDIDQAGASSRQAFETVWRNTPPVERGRILARASALILPEIDQLAIAECLDSGKPLEEALGDVRGAARDFEYYAGACD